MKCFPKIIRLKKSIIEKNINLIFMSSYVYKNNQLHKDRILEGLSGINYYLYPIFIEELSQKAYEEFTYYHNYVYYFLFFLIGLIFTVEIVTHIIR